MSELILPPREQIILAIDTSEKDDAQRLAKVAQEAGARFVKLGLEISSATSWEYCSQLAAEYGLDWVADAKLDDISNTTVKTVRNIRKLEHPPFGITIHTSSGHEAMRDAQEEALMGGDLIKMIGVTVLTSIKRGEAAEMYHTSLEKKVREFARSAVRAGIAGVVCSPHEVGMIKNSSETEGLFAMIPGTRLVGADIQDQDPDRVGTPGAAIRDGANLVVIGRPITGAKNPAEAYNLHVADIEGAL